jgi:hypothetical protein
VAFKFARLAQLFLLGVIPDLSLFGKPFFLATPLRRCIVST